MGIITLNISAQDNRPPNSSGWLSIALAYGATHIFTLPNFTTETSPAYGDPEGDPLDSIKITSLPSQGVLKKGIVAVIANEQITSAELTAGDLTYESDSADTEGYSDGFMRLNNTAHIFLTICRSSMPIPPQNNKHNTNNYL